MTHLETNMTLHDPQNLSHLGFQRIAPCKTLEAFIECYWFIVSRDKTGMGYREFLHPNGSMGIIFNFGDVFSLNENINKNICFLDGTNTKTKMLDLKGEINAAGIRFKPAGAYAFFDFPLNEVKNQITELSNIGPHFTSQLQNELIAHKDEENNIKARIIERFLMSCLLNGRVVSAEIKNSIALVSARKGLLPVQMLAKHIGINQRKLERLFNLQTGMTPGEFSKTIRVAHARDALKQKTMTHTDIAHSLGYYDQAHFIKSFNSIVGITPGEYRQRSQQKQPRPI